MLPRSKYICLLEARSIECWISSTVIVVPNHVFRDIYRYVKTKCSLADPCWEQRPLFERNLRLYGQTRFWNWITVLVNFNGFIIQCILSIYTNVKIIPFIIHTWMQICRLWLRSAFVYGNMSPILIISGPVTRLGWIMKRYWFTSVPANVCLAWNAGRKCNSLYAWGIK